MKSIGRSAELQRVVERLDGFRRGGQRWLHMAVAAPPEGGLADFLDDIAERGAAAGDLTVRVMLDDHRRADLMLEPLNQMLQQKLGLTEWAIDGTLQNTLDLLV